MVVLLIASQLGVFAREVLRLHFWASAYFVYLRRRSRPRGRRSSVVRVTVFDGGPGRCSLVPSSVGEQRCLWDGLRARGRYVGRFSVAELRTMLAYGIPVDSDCSAVWALTFVDRLLLESLGSLSEVGCSEYAMANRSLSPSIRLAERSGSTPWPPPRLFLLVVTAFGIAFSPFALDLRSASARCARGRLTVVVPHSQYGALPIGTALSVFAREALAVLAPAFDEAANTVGLLCLGTLLYGIASVVMLEISIARRTRVFAVYSAIGAAVNVGLNVGLIPSLGPVGAGISTVAAFVVLAVGYWWHAQRIARTPYETSVVIELVAAATIVGSLGLLPLGVLYALAKIAGLAAFVGWLAIRGLLPLRALHSIRWAGGALAPRGWRAWPRASIGARGPGLGEVVRGHGRIWIHRIARRRPARGRRRRSGRCLRQGRAGREPRGRAPVRDCRDRGG